ncbi:5-oxoprolinase subunit C family protein [Marinimicrococcus flavescens]|uniref:Biotin-dependent carboxyltransferase family protein n=1 Tax=Marinimicrococcus flavescens TaxID=3031815 RepID=A0AAP3UY46_9PROT|nr:biotin-dependent carboxyltransferase family protein [Marinimicrococcus flavescens]
MSDRLLVRAPGPLATLQDAGRRGYQRLGVSGSGPMDRLAHEAANRMAGNPPGTVAVELALGGLVLEVAAERVRLAFAGGTFELQIDDKPMPWWSCVTVHRGQMVRIGRAQAGVWGYVAIAGGLALPAQLGSHATHTLSRLGGIEGRPLRAGDALALAELEPSPHPDLMLPDPPPAREVIRAVPGPQDDYFTPAGLAAFFGEGYRVSAQADRMGYRLEGPQVEHAKGFNIVSDGTVAGSVQVPGMGTPIVLMADRQTTGGYPKIATVIGADLPALAQIAPGGRLRFQSVSFEQALEARRVMRGWLDRLADRLEPLRTGADLDPARLLGLNLIGGVTAGDPLREGLVP